MKKMFRRMLVCIMLIGVQMLVNDAVAKTIDVATARHLGAYYMSVMSGKNVAESSQVSLVYQFDNVTGDAASAYVFNVSGQGFVIVSGSDFCYPILGYSTEGELDVDRMAPAFKAYFGEMARRISYAEETGQKLFSDDKMVRLEWGQLYNETLPSENAKASQWMLDECWDQGEIYYPTYNILCPSGPDQYGRTGYAYVGCVATAMAQIMHYWKYPAKGQGYIGGIFTLNQGTPYQTYLGYIDINLEDYTYDWDNMPNACLSYNSPASQKNACGLLCYHCGISVSMNYGFSGSGTQSSYVADAMKNKFRYAAADYLRRSTIYNYVAGGETMNYTDDEWISIMHAEIDAHRPIYYSGYSMAGSGRDAGGHAFVADGYKQIQRDKFHFNWGWGGQPNTWSDLRTGDLSVPAGYGGYNFYFGQSMVIHIQPKTDEVACEPVTGLEMVERGSSSARFQWEGSEGQSMYKVAYGLAKDSIDTYQTVETTINEFEVGNLQSGVWYAMTVQGKCRHTCQYPNGLTAHDTVMWSEWCDTVKFYVGEEPLSVDEVPAQQIAMMPNPAHLQTLVRSDAAMSQIEVYALDGRLMSRQILKDANEAVVDLSALAPDTYMLRVYTEKGLATKKLVVR